MGYFLISYDLGAAIEDYGPFIEEIQKIGNAWQCMESLWVVKSNETSGLLKEQLTQHLNEDDKLLVVGIKRHGASYNLSKECSDLLSKKI
ncbi:MULTISPECIES: hypothetical protein [unclassified Allomuricauda]|jgi:hypothetical protein|uniref:hypothetical protein n=1 Tax=unclassified Allomuricauda TaxID=2615049 RepID=UPI00273E90BA|nr:MULTISPECIES: hypothetical protein [unclassified Allomuricauda]